MNKVDPVVRQQRLLARSAELRLSLADQAQVFKKPLALVDQAQAGVQWLYRNPAWPLGAALLLAITRPRRALLLGGRLWWAWGAFKRVRTLVATLPLKQRKP